MTAAAFIKQAPARFLEWALPYWSRGEAGRPTPPDLFRVLYTGWLIALLFKVLGSSWDVSWHFRWLRDDLAPPHLLNTVGTVIAVALTIVHAYTGYGVDRKASQLIQWGTGIFLVAIPLDLINHRVNGLDITSWSPSHALLYLGTALMLAGVIRGWFLGAPAGSRRTLVLGALFAFFLENIVFPAQHQEYGVREIASWDRGQPYADEELLAFAANQMGRSVDREMVVRFSLPMPDWVYPLWMGVACVLVLVVARRMIDRRFAATAVAGVYLAYRMLIWPLLYAAGFPESAIPFFLLVAAVAVDVAFLVGYAPVRVALGGVLVVGAVYGGQLLQDRLLDAPPPAGPAAAAWMLGLLALGWGLAEWYMRSRQSTGALVNATATP